MRHSKWLTIWLVLLAFLGAPESSMAQHKGRFITRQPVKRVFGGRSRLLVSRRAGASLFNVTDFWTAAEANPKPQQESESTTAESTTGIVVTSYEPIAPEAIPLVVPPPMTFTEESITEPQQLPVITPSSPDRLEELRDVAVPLLPTKPAATEDFETLFDEPAAMQPPAVEELPQLDPSAFGAPQPTQLEIEFEPEPANQDAAGQPPGRPEVPVRSVTLQTPVEESIPVETVSRPAVDDSEPAAVPVFESPQEAQPHAPVFDEPIQESPFQQQPVAEPLIQQPAFGEPATDSESAFDGESPFDDESPFDTEPEFDSQPSQPQAAPGLVSVPAIRQHIAALEGNTAADSTDRAAAIATYNQAIKWLQASEAAQIEADRLEQQASQLPQQLTDATAALEQMRATQPTMISSENTSADQLPTYGEKLRTAIAALQQNRDDLSGQLNQIEQRVQTSAGSKLDMLDAIEQAEQQPTDSSEPQGRAAAAETVARAAMLRSQLALAGVRERTDDVAAKLAEVQVSALDLQLERANAQLATVQQLADQLQEQQAAAEAARLKELANQVPGALKPFADDNARVAEQLKWIKSSLGETRAETTAAKTIHTRVQRSFDRVRKIQDRNGLNTTLGLILNHELEHLPSPRRWQRLLSGVKDQLHDLSEVEFAIERQSRGKDGFSARLNQTLTTLAKAQPQRREDFARIGQQIAESHDTLLADAESAAHEYSEALTAFDDQGEQLVHTIHEFESHINKNVLWIRSNEPLGVSDFAQLSPLAAHLSDANLWVQAADSVLVAIQENLVVLAVFAFLVLVVMAFGDELRSRLKRTGEQASIGGQVRMLPTLEAVAITCLLAFAWPALLWTIGQSIANSLTSTGLALAGGYGLQTAALWLGAFALPRCICMPDGLAHRHFGWRESLLRFAYTGLPKIMRWGVPIVAVVAALSPYEHGMWSGSVGRIVFIAGALSLAFYVRKALDTKQGVIAKCADTDSLVFRIRHFILFGSVGIMLALAITSIAGYHHSALRLTRCLQQTWMTVIGLAVLRGILVRGLDWVTQSFESGRPLIRSPRKLQAFDPNSEEVQAEATQKELAANREQVHRFLHFATAVTAVLCCWGIWHNVLPALNVVNDIQLWSMNREVAVASDTAQAGTVVQTIKQSVPVTLGDLIRGLIVLVVTIAAARSLPGLLDTLVLMRLPFDRGGRHAIATISRYLLITFGLLLTLKQVGIDWASLQWMVAAMTVGLGFGLQEIFANFVSGLIILLERPIRLGDFVTVNGETGFVTRIQFRATTITDLDRRELLVPNKKFITDELINWTLSDPITRLVVPVGIAYGSDTSMAHQLLMEVAAEHPIVLKEPESSAIMTAFGDSTLNFELRVFIPRRDEFAQITHELNTAIDRKFRAANIEIAFPQCDINVRGLDQLAGIAQKRAA